MVLDPGRLRASCCLVRRWVGVHGRDRQRAAGTWGRRGEEPTGGGSLDWVASERRVDVVQAAFSLRRAIEKQRVERAIAEAVDYGSTQAVAFGWELWRWWSRLIARGAGIGQMAALSVAP